MLRIHSHLIVCVFFINVNISIGQPEAKQIQKIPIDSLINEDNTYAFVEKMPEFIGGRDSLKAYLKRAASQIELTTKNKLKGRVYVSFIVTRSGHVYRPRIMIGVSKELNEAAIQIVSSFPLWKPGKQNGESLNVILQLPIDF
jgi:protein TonB